MGARRVVAARAARGELSVVELDSGRNACRIESGGASRGHVARDRCPVRSVGPTGRLHFLVPKSINAFDIFIHASVTGEAARLRVLDPAGVPLAECQGDFDRPERVRVRLGRAGADRVCSLEVVRPVEGGLGLDDVTLWLGEMLPPYLCPDAEAARWFGARRGDGR